MTPRERAEALGVSLGQTGSWWGTSRGCRVPIVERASLGRPRSGTWVVAWPTRWGFARWEYRTDDEALAHALLLRDVVLS